MPEIFQVNPANVVHDVFEDGEAAIIDLRSGTYFSLNPSATLLWPALVSGTSVADLIAHAVALTGEQHRAALEASVPGFVAALREQGLLESVPAAAPIAPDDNPAAPIPTVDSNTFEPPSFERFDDLQDLLLLDPIHDVSDRGWPNAAS